MSVVSDDPLLLLAALVVKDQVHLGGLPARELPVALAWAWAGLPAERTLAEREVNEALKLQLAGALCWLDTDHVELRRWLVDDGWLQRDGFGREYRRVPAVELAAARRPVAAAVDGLETARWTRERRELKAGERARRRAAWAARQQDSA